MTARKDPQPCAVPGCDDRSRARGWCWTHYGRWKAHGDPNVFLPHTLPREERFWHYVDKDAPGGCWWWTASLTHAGYGRWGESSTPKGYAQAHRTSYGWLVGPIPEGMELDHTCHNADPTCPAGDACLHRRCVNPAHLEPVTHRENGRRGMGFAGTRSRQTHCKRGHLFDEANTYITGRGTRCCRACRWLTSPRNKNRIAA